LDAGIVRGSHGLPRPDPQDAAILIGHGRKRASEVEMTEVEGDVVGRDGLGGMKKVTKSRFLNPMSWDLKSAWVFEVFSLVLADGNN